MGQGASMPESLCARRVHRLGGYEKGEPMGYGGLWAKGVIGQRAYGLGGPMGFLWARGASGAYWPGGIWANGVNQPGGLWAKGA